MKLAKLCFREFLNKPNSWELEEFNLSSINLITAKNATGKSRIINVIKSISLLLDGKRGILSDASFEALFKDGNDTYLYSVDFGVNHIKREIFKHNDIIKIDRTNNLAKIYYEKIDNFIDSDTPSNLLCISRRDKLQHPYLEKIIKWAQNTVVFYFGSDLGKHTLFSPPNENQNININIKDTNNVQMIFMKAKEKFTTRFTDKVINDVGKLGYDISSISLGIMKGISIPNSPIQSLSGIFVKEKDIRGKVDQNSISQGMFRAISIIIQLNYLELSQIPCCVAIDDIGEGLDFERSTALINLIIDKSKKSFVQLIMTTNDRFVMNAVELENWCVLVREKQKCKVINYENSKDIFDDFKYTGLNNFDFLSTEFYINGLDEK